MPAPCRRCPYQQPRTIASTRSWACAAHHKPAHRQSFALQTGVPSVPRCEVLETPSSLQFPGFAKYPDWRAHRNTSEPQRHSVVGVSQHFQQAVQRCGQEEIDHVGASCDRDDLRSWTRPSAVTSNSELEPTRRSSNSCRSLSSSLGPSLVCQIVRGFGNHYFRFR